jgi:hypothetical protein
MSRRMARVLLALVVAGAVVVFADGASAAGARVGVQSAQANSATAIMRPAGVPATATIVSGTMSLNCASLTGTAKAYADAKGYCGKSTGVQPNDYREGDCGFSYLYMWDNGGGYAGMSFGVGSSLGAILHISSHVSWANWTYGISGAVDGSGFVWSANYDRNTEAYTAAGFVTGAYSGSVTLVWGGQCTILIPTDSTDVSW